MGPKKAVEAEDQLDALADELYLVPPESFISSRDERVHALAADGEKKLAASVQALRKPTLAAWAVNLLVRLRREQVEKFVALGPELAAAQRELDGEALQTLASRRQRVVHALVREARELAADAGHPVGGAAAYEVESTLHAALADPDIADRVLSGRLLRPESYAGLGPLPEVADRPRSGGAQSAPDVTATRAKPEAVRSAEKREGERLLAQAQSALEEAERRSAEASTELDKARDAREELEQQATHLRDRLADVERRVAEVDLDRRRLGQLADRAAIHVDRARKQVDVAQRRVQRDS